MTFDEELKQLEIHAATARQALAAAENRIDELYVRRSKETYGVEPGMRVRYKNKEYEVFSIQPRRWDGKPWLTARLVKKDGKLGTGLHTLFDSWEFV